MWINLTNFNQCSVIVQISDSVRRDAESDGGRGRRRGRKGRPRVAAVDLSRSSRPSPQDQHLGLNHAHHGAAEDRRREPNHNSQTGRPARATDTPIGGSLARDRVSVTNHSFICYADMLTLASLGHQCSAPATSRGWAPSNGGGCCNCQW